MIGGSGGAAARLGLKRTTLIAKMKKLGISRPVRKDDINPLSENRESEQWWHPQLNEETSNGGYGKVSSRPSLH